MNDPVVDAMVSQSIDRSMCADSDSYGHSESCRRDGLAMFVIVGAILIFFSLLGLTLGVIVP